MIVAFAAGSMMGSVVFVSHPSENEQALLVASVAALAAVAFMLQVMYIYRTQISVGLKKKRKKEILKQEFSSSLTEPVLSCWNLNASTSNRSLSSWDRGRNWELEPVSWLSNRHLNATQKHQIKHSSVTRTNWAFYISVDRCIQICMRQMYQFDISAIHVISCSHYLYVSGHPCPQVEITLWLPGKKATKPQLRDYVWTFAWGDVICRHVCDDRTFYFSLKSVLSPPPFISHLQSSKLTPCFQGRRIEGRCQCLGPRWPHSCPPSLWGGCDETVWLKPQTSSCLPAGTQQPDEQTANHLRDTGQRCADLTRNMRSRVLVIEELWHGYLPLGQWESDFYHYEVGQLPVMSVREK